MTTPITEAPNAAAEIEQNLLSDSIRTHAYLEMYGDTPNVRQRRNTRGKTTMLSRRKIRSAFRQLGDARDLRKNDLRMYYIVRVSRSEDEADSKSPVYDALEEYGGSEEVRMTKNFS